MKRVKWRRPCVLRKICSRPDEVVWSLPWTSFCVGFSIQRYGWDARAVTICIGVLTLRWHDR